MESVVRESAPGLVLVFMSLAVSGACSNAGPGEPAEDSAKNKTEVLLDEVEATIAAERQDDREDHVFFCRRWRPAGSTKLSCPFKEPGDLNAVSDFERLKILALFQVPSNTDLRAIGEVQQLEELTIAMSGELDLQPLAKLTKLEVLRLQDTKVTDLGPLGNLTSLRVLDLTGTPIFEMSPVSDLDKLQVFTGSLAPIVPRY